MLARLKAGDKLNKCESVNGFYVYKLKKTVVKLGKGSTFESATIVFSVSDKAEKQVALTGATLVILCYVFEFKILAHRL